MGLLDRPGQPQRYGLLSPTAMGAINSAATMPAPAPAAAPRRGRVNGLRVAFDALLGNGDPFESLDNERARLEAEPLREASRARMMRLQSYVDTLSPDLQLAYEANREKLGEAFASRGEAVTLNRGDVRMVGDRPVYGAPFDAAPGVSVFNPLDPSAPIAVAQQENKVAGGALVAPDGRVLYRGPAVEGVAATADAFVTPEIARGQGGGAPQIQRSARPDAVTVAPGGEVISFGSDGSVAGRVASSQPRPMSDADQAAVARAENTLAANRVARSRAAQFREQLTGGDLNLGPLTNAVGGIRNRLGRSTLNSLNQDALMNWAKEARDAILSANTGVQTDGDAVRALDRIISTPNDERVVAAALQRFEESQAATAEVFRRDIARRSASPAQASAAAAGRVSGPIAEDAQGNRVQWNGSAWVPMR